MRREVFTGKSNYIIQVKNLKKAREIRRPIIWISNEEKSVSTYVNWQNKMKIHPIHLKMLSFLKCIHSRYCFVSLIFSIIQLWIHLLYWGLTIHSHYSSNQFECNLGRKIFFTIRSNIMERLLAFSVTLFMFP